MLKLLDAGASPCPSSTSTSTTTTTTAGAPISLWLPSHFSPHTGNRRSPQKRNSLSRSIALCSSAAFFIFAIVLSLASFTRRPS